MLNRAALLPLVLAVSVLCLRTSLGGDVSLGDDRKDGRPVALLPTKWTDEARNAAVPLSEYPRPQMVRPDWLCLNGTWDYLGGKDKPDPTAADGTPPAFDRPEKILVPFVPESYLSGVMRKRETNLWYRRSFEVPSKWAGQHLLLHLDGVISRATVFVNGHRVGAHEGAWDAFEFDVTSFLRPGSNELVIGAWDNQDGHRSCGKNCVSQGDYTLSTGIWQPVWLEPVPEVSIGALAIRPDAGQSKVRIAASLSAGAGQVEAIVRQGGKVVARSTAPAGTDVELAIPDARLWSPEDPFLYDLTVRVRDGSGKVVDEVASYFGMRSAGIGKVKGQLRPTLNGKFTFMMGPLDQGYWPDGIYTAPTDAALRSDLETIKKLGFNLVRKHAKLERQRWYYWCDKLGLMAWQDMPSMWYPEDAPEQTRGQFEREWSRIIDQHANSPAIVGWVPFNENWGAYDVPRITDWTRQLDPTRLVNGNTGYNNAPGYRPPPGDPKNGDFDDLHIYVGPGRPPVPTATRAACLGEYGGVGLRVPGHMWPCDTNSYQLLGSGEALTRRYEGLQADLAKLVRERGLGAAIYTQVSDVEHEVNGFLTYDRKVEKMDFARVRAANEQVLKAAAEVGDSGR